MADIELVIKISEEKLSMIKNEMYCGIYDAELYKAIANGTPLPKGHGDLIDRGELKTHIVGTEQGTDLEVYLEPTIINAPTIIEADRSEEKCQETKQ